MPKSKQRKSHKNKLNNFKNKVVQKHNRVAKMQNMFMEQIRINQEHSKREHIIETIFNAKSELAKEVQLETENGHVTTYQLNEEHVEMVGNALTWKSDGNPLLAGLEPLENYPLYTIELVNAYLNNIYMRKQYEKQNMDKLQAQEIVDLSAELGDVSDDFIVEDPSYKKEEETTNS